MSDNSNAQDKATGLTYLYNDICPAPCKGGAPPSSTTSSNPPTSTTASNPPVATQPCDSPSSLPDSAPECVKKCASIKIKEGYCPESLPFRTYNDAYKQCMSDNCSTKDQSTGLQYKYQGICRFPPPTSTTSSNPPAATGTCDTPAGVADSAPACVKKCASIKVKEGYCSSKPTFTDAYSQCMSNNCNTQDKSTGLNYKYDNICPADCKGSAPSTTTTTSNPPAATQPCDSPAGVPASAPKCVRNCASVKVKEGYCPESIPFGTFDNTYKLCMSDNCNVKDRSTGQQYNY